jgi:hypothetical protein
MTHDPRGLRWVQIPGFVEAETRRG